MNLTISNQTKKELIIFLIVIMGFIWLALSLENTYNEQKLEELKEEKIKLEQRNEELFQELKETIHGSEAGVSDSEALASDYKDIPKDDRGGTSSSAVEISTPSAPVSDGIIREVTMYTSRPEETDETPCISADGTNICEVDYNVCATNAFPIGTRLYVDKLGECIVKDVMSRKYSQRIDWYAGTDVERALAFGIQRLKVSKID